MNIYKLRNDYLTGQKYFTAQELVNLADTMKKARAQLKEWSTLSTEQEEIVALNTKFTQLEHLTKNKNKDNNKNKNEEKSETRTEIG